MTPYLRRRLVTLGRLFFAAALLAFGLQHLIYARFVTRLIPAWPAPLPAPQVFAIGVGVLLLLAALLMAWGTRVRLIALSFAALCLVSFLALHLPIAFAAPRWGGEWTSAGKALTFCALGLVVARTAAGAGQGAPAFAASTRSFLVARLFFAAFLILAGIQHFLWWRFVQTLVPAWVGAGAFWTFLTGVALLAAGVGLLVPRALQLAGLLTGAMILSWVFLVHLPRALADLHNANETTALFEALAFSGLGFLIAGSGAQPKAEPENG